MTWSKISRRQLPTHLSAIPLCQDAWAHVRWIAESLRNQQLQRLKIADGWKATRIVGPGQLLDILDPGLQLPSSIS